MRIHRSKLVPLAGAVAALTVLAAAPSGSADSAVQPFPVLASGFTQELYGTAPSFLGGVAFLSGGDLVADRCQYYGSPLWRFDRAVTTTVHGSVVHPSASIPSSAGCGLVSHTNGHLYSNVGSGLAELDGATGAFQRVLPGDSGNALGVSVDPQTGHLVYVGYGSLTDIDPVTGTVTHRSDYGSFDQIVFDPAGDFIFGSYGASVRILRRDGSYVQDVPVGHYTDGMAFHADGEQFVLTNNTDGTMSRLDFPGNDYTKPAVVSDFASGGFRGDMTVVGSDSCLYLTQAGTRYADGTQTGDNSVVRLCPGFAPQVPVKTKLTAHPAIADVSAAAKPYLTMSATLVNSATSKGVAKQAVTFAVGGKAACTAVTDAAGYASCGAPADLASVAVNRGYEAAFAGKTPYLPSAGHGAVLTAGGAQL